MTNLIKSVSRSQHLIISDVLLLHDDEEEALISSLKENSMGCGGGVFDCASPRRIVDRLVGGLRRRKDKEIEIDEQSKVGGNEEAESVVCRDSSSSAAPAVNDPSPERCGRDFSFNLGVGGCLLYLIAASRSELDKMMELRAEMEKIVEKAKQESQRKDEISSSTPETNEIFTYSAESESNRRRSLQIPNLNSDLVQSENHVAAAEGMKQLEAELEVELERLQLCLDIENLNNPIQQVIDEENESARSSSFILSEVINPRNEAEMNSGESRFGVSPIELERRLHELLESKQQEQIRELEAALREKETEISWWKDTVRILSRHVSKSPRPFWNFQ